MDENYEIFLAKAIENKVTVHGRRKESVLYLNHRVKKKDLLKVKIQKSVAFHYLNL